MEYPQFMRSIMREIAEEMPAITSHGNQKCGSVLGDQGNPVKVPCAPRNARNSGVSAPQCLSARIAERSVAKPVVINKYPGTLHIVLDALEKMNAGTGSQVSLECFFDGRVMATRKYHEGSFIKINRHMRIPVTQPLASSLRIRIVLRRHWLGRSSDALETTLDLTTERLGAMHNKLEEIKTIWRPCNRGVLGLVSNVLFAPKSKDALLRMYCSFISDEEIVPSHPPKSLTDLCKWIIVRKYACDCLFEGSLNIKGEDRSYSWKRRHVKWYGYTLYIFDMHTSRVTTQVTLVDAVPSLDQVGDGILKFKMDDSELKMHCDTSESLVKCIEAAYTIFPKMLDWV